MSNHIEGTFSWHADGFPAIRLEDGLLPLTDGKEIRVNHGEEWVPGIHVYGDVLRNGKTEMLMPGDRIQIRRS
ncbi:hypothetical protein JQN58_18675 [Aneurinibacillus sp. BA2021]|nr:hypothetical protein [Aneurinibacillus sp. BA2021]